MFSSTGLIKRVFGYFTFSDIVLLLSFILIGGFNDYIACGISVALLINLLLKIYKTKCLKININPIFVTTSLMVLFYGLTVFWAIDWGMAIVGFLKFLPLVIYLLLLYQYEGNVKLLHILPYFAAVLTIISSIGSFIPVFKDTFLVSERLAGFFQYPNTFAILLLVSELLILKKLKLRWFDYLAIAVLIGGLLYTGSRTAFLLFLASNFLMILMYFSKKNRLVILAVALLVVAGLLAVAVLGPDGNILSRYLKIGLTQSTFVGRILYTLDALPLLLKYPFGMGYLGYFFTHGSIQTGVYNITYVHNDFLQLFLDVGIIPAVLFIAAVIHFFFKKNVPVSNKIIVGVFAIHNIFEFNLQFVGMFLLFLLLLNDNSGKEITLKNITPFKFIIPLTATVCLYMGIALGLSHFTLYSASNVMYPFNTNNQLLMLDVEEDVSIANQIADEILKRNTYYYVPYSIKSTYAYSNGDFLGVIENKNIVFTKNRFKYTEFRDYAVMLANGIVAYEESGQPTSAETLRKELAALKDYMTENGKNLSKLGSMIEEQPILTLPEDVLYYINNPANEGGVSN